MKKIFFPGILMLLLFSSCKHHDPNTALVTGGFSDGAGLIWILQEMGTHEIRTVDSVIAGKDGTFRFSTVLTEPGFRLLQANSGKILVLLLSPGDTVELSGRSVDFPDRVILKGPKDAILLNDFFRRTRVNERTADSLDMVLAEYQDSACYFRVTQRLDTLYRKVWEGQRSCETEFILKNPASLASLVVLNYAFGMSPVLSPEEDFDYYLMLDSALSGRYPANSHVKYHHQRVEEIRRKREAGK